MSEFRFKQFLIDQTDAPFKVGTDSMVLGSWVKLEGEEKVLDIGTGTGILALMMAQKLKSGTVLAIEPNRRAFDIASLNFDNSDFSDRIISVNEPLQRIKPNEKLDVIISNPPYFSNSTLNAKSAEIQARHTETLGFDEIVTFSKTYLKENGRLIIILPLNEYQIFKTNAKKSGYIAVKELHMTSFENSKTIRVCAEFTQVSANTEIKSLAIRNSVDNSYSEDYLELTKAYHFKI